MTIPGQVVWCISGLACEQSGAVTAWQVSRLSPLNDDCWVELSHSWTLILPVFARRQTVPIRLHHPSKVGTGWGAPPPMVVGDDLGDCPGDCIIWIENSAKPIENNDKWE
jgi:hypothetical protein